MAKNKVVDKTLFAQRMKQRLVDLNITQTQLAKKAGIATSAMSDYIHGSRLPRVAEFAQLSIALEVSMDWLWGIDEETSYSNDLLTENQHLRNYIERISTELLKLAQEGYNLSPKINIIGSNTISGGIGNTNINISKP